MTDLVLTLMLDFLLLLALYFLYRPVLSGPFTFDDLTILNNIAYMRKVDPLTSPNEPPLTRSPHATMFKLSAYLQSAVLLNIISFTRSRSLTNLTYEWNVSRFGLNPRGFHQTSLVIAGLLIVAFHHLLIPFVHPIAAFTGALILAVAPLCTMAVSYIAGRSSLLAGMFIVIAALCGVHGWWMTAAFMGIAAIMSKEEGVVTFPILLALWIGGIHA